MLGGGSWGTALIKVLSENNRRIKWWIRNPEIIQSVKTLHRNPRYLSSVEINLNKVKPTNKLKRVIRYSDIIFLAIPSAYLQSTLKDVPIRYFKKKIIVSTIKGIIPDSNLLIAEYFNQKYKVPISQFVIISGPSHAEEVALEKLSYLTIASQNARNAGLISAMLKCRYIKTSTTDDIYGTEYTAILKNIVAIASGICHGLGYGDNFQAVLISNAIQEINRFVDSVHPINRDIKGSAYLGDLLVTTYSQFSRNRTFGNMIGKGYSVQSAQVEMDMVAEGYFAAKSIQSINLKYKVDMPIIESVYRILYEEASAALEMEILTDRLS